MMITEFIAQYHLGGIFVGLATFLIIGIYHPLVIKGEYYFGQKIKWWFLVAALAFLAASVYVDGIILSTLFGVASFSSLWSIKEVSEQAERVRKGWFPANPARTARNKGQKS